MWVILRCAHVGGTQVCTCGWYSGVHMYVLCLVEKKKSNGETISLIPSCLYFFSGGGV